VEENRKFDLLLRLRREDGEEKIHSRLTDKRPNIPKKTVLAQIRTTIMLRENRSG